jgi:hypothetical protein
MGSMLSCGTAVIGQLYVDDWEQTAYVWFFCLCLIS